MALLDHGQKVDLDLNPKTHKVHLVCGRYEANVAGIDAEDFPPIPRCLRRRRPSRCRPRLLKETINQVVFAAAPDDTRPVLAGVLVKLAEGTLTLAAADGFRLAVRTLDVPRRHARPANDRPRQDPDRGRATAARHDEEVAISTTPNGNQVYFAFAKTEITVG